LAHRLDVHPFGRIRAGALRHQLSGKSKRLLERDAGLERSRATL
jgi:hypothetical protein